MPLAAFYGFINFRSIFRFEKFFCKNEISSKLCVIIIMQQKTEVKAPVSVVDL